MRKDSIVEINIEPYANYEAYGINELVSIVPSVVKDVITIKKIKQNFADNDYELTDSNIAYEDTNSIIYLNHYRGYAIIHFRYDANFKNFIYYQATIDMFHLTAKENLEMAFNSLRNAKYLNTSPSYNPIKQPDTWEDYNIQKPKATIKGYNHALRNVDKEMKVFMEEGKSYDLRNLYNYSTFEFYYSTKTFKGLFNLSTFFRREYRCRR